MPTPVSIVSSGGIPVTNTPLGTPMSPVEAPLYGPPVTVIEEGGIPVHLVNDDLTDWTDFDFFVDSVNGDDGNDGSEAAPWATIEHFLANSGTGDAVGLKAGQYHPASPTKSIGRRYGKWGLGADPIMDARQSLAGKTWTLDSGTIWKTTITLASNSVAGGVGSNTTNFGVWSVNDEFAEWMVGGADIAANLTALQALSGLGFAVNRTGSTVQDIRSDTPGTGFDLFVKLADGGDPNGLNLKCSYRSAAGSFNGGEVRNCVLLGGFGKDSVGVAADSYGGNVITLRDVTVLDFGEHGWVGPCNVVGTYTARGRPRKGVSTYAKGRAAGAGLNIFTNTYVSTRDLSFQNLDIADCANGFYGHGSGNRGYRDVTVSGTVTLDNVTNGIQMDVATGTVSFVAGTLTINSIQATDIDQAFAVDGNWIVNGGSVAFDPDPLNPAQQRLVSFVGTAPTCLLKNLSANFTLVVQAGKARILVGRNTDNTHTTPILTLDTCTDISAAGKKGHLQRGGTGNIQSKTDLRVINGSDIGDLMDQATGTNYPAALTVDAGGTFGMGDRTGSQIETALTGASVPFTISHNTTVVNRAGTITSNPGW